MKFYLTLLLILLSFFGVGQVNLNNGLVAYYPFSGNANDASGNGNDGIVIKAVLTNDRNGTPNSAYQFDGATSFIRIPNSSSFAFGSNLSLVAYVKPTGFYTGACHGNSIIFKGFGDPDPSLTVLRFEDGQYENYNNCSMPMDPAHQNFYGQHTFVPPGYSPYIALDQWYCVVYTYDGTVAKLYIDGVLKVSNNFPGAYYTNSEDIYLGLANQPGFPYWFKGVLDEVRIYNRAINSQEVSALCGCVNATIDAQPHDSTVCEGSPVGFNVSARNSNSYQWQIQTGSGWNSLVDDNTYSGSQSGNLSIKNTTASMNQYKYRVVVSNCTSITSSDATLNITPVLKPSVLIKSSGNNLCGVSPITFTSTAVNAGSNPFYSWFKNNVSVGANSYTYIDNNIQNGDVIYNKIITTGTCPVFAISNSITMNVYLDTKNVRYPSINYNSTNPIQLNARQFPNASYVWVPSLGLDNNLISNPNFNLNRSIEYLINISQSNGCKIVDTLALNVYSKIDILVPTAFTPNNDGRNDKIFPTLLGIKTLNFFKIFNRWGNLIFESNESTRSTSWNGDFKGEKQQIGSYMWIAEGVDFDGNTIKRSGSIALIR